MAETIFLHSGYHTMSTKIAVAMSGGVDSSVAALLLTQQGYDVIGISMRLMNGTNDEGACCSLESIGRAKSVCYKLHIPHYTVNFSAQFQELVVQDFCNTYAQGRTPNPCLQCNRHIKFDGLLNWVHACGIEYLATGHYALINKLGNRMALSRAVDNTKNQSYALHTLTQEQLSSTLFPLGRLHKVEVRALAQQYNLASAQTPESQDICFIPNGNYREFLNAYITKIPGIIYDCFGNRIGEHKSIANFTVGQRARLNFSNDRLYVISIDVENNSIVVGAKENLPTKYCLVENLNWISLEPAEVIQGEAEVRYGSTPTSAELVSIGENKAVISLPNNKNCLTPGQSIVMYQGDMVLVGGVMTRVWN